MGRIYHAVSHLSCEGRAIIFIDHIDLCPNNLGVWIEDCSNGILVLGATNSPWDLDSSVIREFERRVYIPMPDAEARSKMVKIRLGDTPNNLTESDFHKVGQMTEGASGSDIGVLVKKALMEPVRKCEQAQQFLPSGNYLVPCEQYPNCSHCPTKLPTDPSNKNYDCSRCGAKDMQLWDVPSGKLKFPDDYACVVKDFESVPKNSYLSVSKEELEKYEDWTKQTKKFGIHTFH